MDPVDYEFSVRTGDRKFAGTDANIKVILHGDGGRKTDKMRLHNVFKDDFEQGQLDTFLVKKQFKLKNIEKLELWRDNFGFGSRWYVDYVKVKRKDQETEFVFPIFRWVPANTHMVFRVNDTMLPSQDPEQQQRWNELQEKRKSYIVCQKIPGGPPQVNVLDNFASLKFQPSYFEVCT